ncbi:MAG: DUF4390 domain-containing protein [Desulfovibrio sp.]|nr:DUF4390 domain-containing protein [Desulfovibrio sp.]
MSIPFNRHVKPCSGRGNPAAFLLIPLFCMLASSAFAVAPRRLIADPPPVLRIDDDVLTTEISIAVDNEADLLGMLKDGAILELGISASVERLRSILGNAALGRREYISVIRHDPLSREFLMSVPDADKDRELRDRNLTRLLHAGWSKLILPVISLEVLRDEGEDEKYAVNMEITLRHADVPPWLQKNFVFWSSEVAPQLNFTLPFAFGGR